MLTVIVPFYQGNATLGRLLSCIPPEVPAVVVDDHSPEAPVVSRPNTRVVRGSVRGYFAGAVNVGLAAVPEGDVAIVNQDAWMEPGWAWVAETEAALERFGIAGEIITANPRWPAGYVSGTFMAIRRDVIDRVGGMDAEHYPMWGCTCLYQLQAVRAGFGFGPVDEFDAWFHHHEHRERGEVGEAFKTLGRDSKWFLLPPEVSVCICNYNYGRYLPLALQSLQRQTFQDFEVVVVDDASTDHSWEICREYHNPANGVRCFRHGQNAGTAFALNTAVKKAAGRHIVVLSADDELAPNALERMAATSRAYPHHLVYTDIERIDERGEHIKTIVMKDYDFDTLLQRNFISATAMYPRAAWAEVGGYPTRFNHGREDWAFAVALGRAGYCGIKIPEPLLKYRWHGQNRTETNLRTLFLDHMRKEFPDLYGGRRPAMCCGSSPTSPAGKGLAAADKAAKAAQTGNMVVMVYTGDRSGTFVVRGKATRTRYLFGANDSNREQAVWPADVADLKARGFRVKPAPVPPPSPPKAAPAAAAPVVQVVLDIPAATRAAAALAPVEPAAGTQKACGLGLVAIKGLGPARRRILEDLGIGDCRALVDEDPGSLALRTGFSQKQLAAWQQAAFLALAGEGANG